MDLVPDSEKWTEKKGRARVIFWKGFMERALVKGKRRAEYAGRYGAFNAVCNLMNGKGESNSEQRKTNSVHHKPGE